MDWEGRGGGGEERRRGEDGRKRGKKKEKKKKEKREERRGGERRGEERRGGSRKATIQIQIQSSVIITRSCSFFSSNGYAYAIAMGAGRWVVSAIYKKRMLWLRRTSQSVMISNPHSTCHAMICPPSNQKGISYPSTKSRNPNLNINFNLNP